MDKLTDLEHALFSLANIDPAKLKYAAQAINFLSGLDKDKPSYEQVKNNYRMIAILSKYQQVYMTPGELDEMRAEQAHNARSLQITHEPARQPAASQPPANGQPARQETAACEKHCCAECSKAEDIDGKNSYCPESGKVHNKTEYHECQPGFSPGKTPVKVSPKTDKKVMAAIGEYEPTEDELIAKAVYDRNYRPQSSTWNNRKTDLIDARAYHDSTLSRRENNQIIRDIGKAEYCRDAYHY
jgi:hypothetical protein